MTSWTTGIPMANLFYFPDIATTILMRPDHVLTTNPGQGTSLSVAGGTYQLLLTGDQTNGQLAIIDMLIPPGGGPGPHAHASITETFYVLDGEVVFCSETQTYTARKGAVITIPTGGAVHMFKNESDQVAHLLCTVAPAGLDAMFAEIGQPVEVGQFLPPVPMTPERLQQMQTIAQQYGQEVFPPDYFANQ